MEEHCYSELVVEELSLFCDVALGGVALGDLCATTTDCILGLICPTDALTSELTCRQLCRLELVECPTPQVCTPLGTASTLEYGVCGE